MPNLQTIHAGISELSKGPPLVVAFTGATTGIGCYTAKALARTFAKEGLKLRVYIVARNASRAEEVLNYGRETAPGSEWRFIHASDLSLIKEVDKASQEIFKQENESPFAGGPARLDILFMSQALSPLRPSETTLEGLNTQLSLLYYSRMRLVTNLTPLLATSPTTSHVISVFAGNINDAIAPSENPIGAPSPPTYNMNTVRRNTTFMKTFFFEELAEKHAGKISFVHIYPGLVDGPNFYNDVNPLWFRILWRILKPFLLWYMTGEKDCGDIMLFMATKRYAAKGAVQAGEEGKIVGGLAYSSEGRLGGGAYRIGRKGEDTKGMVSFEKLRKGDTAKKVWDHTMGIFMGIEEKNAQ